MLRFLVVLLVLAAIALMPFGPFVIVYSIMLIVTAPIGLVLLAAPALALFVGIAYFLNMMLYGAFNRNAWFLAFCLSLLILALIPIIPNRNLHEQAQAHYATDFDRLELPGKMRTIALVRDYQSGCDDLCRRILVNGQAEQVAVAYLGNNTSTFDPNLRAALYRLEPRELCPDIEIQDPGSSTDFDEEKGLVDLPSSFDLINLEMNRGNCLVEQASTIGTADVAVYHNLVADPILPDGFKLFARKLKIREIRLYMRGSNNVRPVYKMSTIGGYRLVPVLIPLPGLGPNPGGGAGRSNERLQPTYLRDETTYQPPEDGLIRPTTMASFLNDRLGLRMTITSDAGRSQLISAVDAILDGRGPIAPHQLALVKAVFATRSRDQTIIPVNHRSLVLRVLADERITGFATFERPVSDTGKVDADFRSKATEILLDRVLTHVRNPNSELSWDVRSALDWFSLLPSEPKVGEIIRRRWSELLEVADAFMAEGVLPPFGYLIDYGGELGAEYFERHLNSSSDEFTGRIFTARKNLGFSGLCRLAMRGELKDPYRDILKAWMLAANDWQRWQHVYIYVLAALGTEREEISRLLDERVSGERRWKFEGSDLTRRDLRNCRRD